MTPFTSGTHLLVYPWTDPGHIIPVLDLVDLLLRRGLTITIIISDANLQLLDPLLSLYPSSLHKLIFPDPEISPSAHPVIAKITSTKKLFNPIVQWFKSHPSPPTTIISDFFYWWTTELASHLGIRRVMFTPTGALAFSLYHTLWRDMTEINANNPTGDESFLISFPEIPNSPEFPWWQLIHSTNYYKTEDSDFESFRKGIMLANMTSWGIVYNTCERLEGIYIDHIKKLMGHDRVWAVGPLLPDEDGPMGSNGRGGSSAIPSNDLLMWLDKKPKDSVVYICFGSLNKLTEKQISALTNALELSTVEFILCLKESVSSFIPSGFEDRVAGRGFLIKGWAPQMAILKHQAVGSFVTHCGWNSILEGIAAGVLMLTWPMGKEHYIVAKLLVDQLGVGKRVCEGGTESVPDSAGFARLLDETSSVDRSERVKVKELSQYAIKAVKEGTSKQDLDMFVNLISEL